MPSARQVPGSGPQRRTHAALLKAAADLLRAGKTPTVSDAAEAADVSRRTAYRYFPTQEQLLTEAALETLRSPIESAFTSIETDPYRRLEEAVRAIQAEAIKNEHLLRTMIRLTLDRSNDGAESSQPRRGVRRRDFIEGALAPVRASLAKGSYARLVASLCLSVGPEALIVLRDVLGLSHQQAIEISVWSSRALLTAAMTEAADASRGPTRARKRRA